MHSGIVNGYQLLCDVHTVPKQHRAALFIFYLLSSFSLCVCHFDNPISFLGVLSFSHVRLSSFVGINSSNSMWLCKFPVPKS